MFVIVKIKYLLYLFLSLAVFSVVFVSVKLLFGEGC